MKVLEPPLPSGVKLLFLLKLPFLLLLNITQLRAGSTGTSGEGLINPRENQHKIPMSVVIDPMLTKHNLEYFKRIAGEMNQFTVVSSPDTLVVIARLIDILPDLFILCRTCSSSQS